MQPHISKNHGYSRMDKARRLIISVNTQKWLTTSSTPFHGSFVHLPTIKPSKKALKGPKTPFSSENNQNSSKNSKNPQKGRKGIKIMRKKEENPKNSKNPKQATLNHMVSQNHGQTLHHQKTINK